MSNSADIEKILKETQRIAVVGFSGTSRRAGYYVPAYLQENGYEIIPVNPNLEVGLGELVYPDLFSIPEQVDLVLVFRRPEFTPAIVADAVKIKSKAVWLQLGISHPEAAAIADEAGIPMVMDACMLVEHRQWDRR